MSTASMLEAEMEGLNKLNDSESTTTCEPENPQGLQDVDQQMDSATSEPAQDGERTTVVRRVGDSQYVGATYHIPAGSDPSPVRATGATWRAAGRARAGARRPGRSGRGW